MRRAVASPGLSGRVVYSITSGGMGAVKNRTMDNEVCKQGSEEQDGIKSRHGIQH